MRDKKKEDANRGKPNWEHLSDELHVLITVEDTPNRANMKMQRAIEEVRKLLVPVTDGEDELKKRQLMELAIINGTYRDSSVRQGQDMQMQTPISIQALARPATMGAPLIISPARHMMSHHQPHLMSASPNNAPPLIPAETSLMYASPHDAFYHHYATLAAQQHLLESTYPSSQNSGGNDSMNNGVFPLLTR